MNKSHLTVALCAAVFSFIALPSHVVLLSVPGGQVAYAIDQNSSWQTNANLALTNQIGMTLSSSEMDNTAKNVGSTVRSVTMKPHLPRVSGVTYFATPGSYL